MSVIDVPQAKAALPPGSAVTETRSIGNRGAGLRDLVLSNADATAVFIGVRWDGDKVRGVRIELSNGDSLQAGGYDDGGYTLTTHRFAPGEKLVQAWLRDSGYGYRSLRQVEFLTSAGYRFRAGPDGYDNQVELDVAGKYLDGFHAWVNPDNFINAFAFIVVGPPAAVPNWFQTHPIGNGNAASVQVDKASATSFAREFAVRWDGDKVRGVRMTLKDGTVYSAGGIDDGQYTLSKFEFTDDETLESLSYSSSGYGYGSLRRLDFTTSRGRSFSAGPEGIDDILRPPVAGARFVGFHAWVNPDNFINAFAFHVTNNAPMRVRLSNYSPWSASYENGTVMIDGKAAITVADQGTDKHGLLSDYSRCVRVSSGPLTGYCAYDGAALLTISLFGDATFEAKFDLDYGDGAVYGPIAGRAPSADKFVVMDALVRKYAPIFTLNVDEVYWVSNVDGFLGHMMLQKIDQGRPRDFFPGPMNRANLAEQAVKLGANNANKGAALRTVPDLNQPSDTQGWFNGTRPADGSQVTSYAVVSEGQDKRVDITYWWFFNYNQGKTVAGTSWGNHVSDWEHVRVELGNVDFARPQQEQIVGVMFDHHGDQETHPPGDGIMELCGRQVVVHLANGDHEAYPKAGVYDRPMSTHDYCKENAWNLDQRLGTLEIYRWSGTDMMPVPPGAPPSFRDPGWVKYLGRWGNWERGSLGPVSQLESGPEGMLRPGEYPPPR